MVPLNFEAYVHEKLDDIIQRLVRVETNQLSFVPFAQRIAQLEQDNARIKGIGKILSLIWTAFGAAFTGHMLWGKR